MLTCTLFPGYGGLRIGKTKLFIYMLYHFINLFLQMFYFKYLKT